MQNSKKGIFAISVDVVRNWRQWCGVYAFRRWLRRESGHIYTDTLLELYRNGQEQQQREIHKLQGDLYMEKQMSHALWVHLDEVKIEIVTLRNEVIG